MTPEKNEIVMIIPLVPGTAIPENFKYNPYIINKNEISIVNNPTKREMYNGALEKPVKPLKNSFDGFNDLSSGN